MPEEMGNAIVTIPTDGGSFSAIELQTAMAIFRGRYVASYEISLAETGYTNFNTDDHIFRIIEGYRYSLELEITNGFKELHSDDDLYITDLKRTNPIEILVFGLAGPLAAAVVLSGGKLQVGPLKVELPPIGRGIAALRDSLRPHAPKKIEEMRVAQPTKPKRISLRPA